MQDKTAAANDDDALDARADALRDVLKRHCNDADKVGHYDPMLGAISPPSGHKRMCGGYKIWPEKGPDPSQTLRILSMGNSTAVWPAGNWSELIAERLAAEGHPLTLFHGAGKGSTSTQELTRVLRDAPGIAPHLIFALSGITDIGYLLLARDNPFAHKYTRRVMDFVADTEMVTAVEYGYPNTLSPAQVWCRNQRMARVIADEMGIPLLVFLQPVQGYGAYPMSAEEEAFFRKKAAVTLRAAEKSYGECVTEFYDEVRATIAAEPAKYDHVIDLTDALADCPGAYRDHRHQSPKGVACLAERMLPVIRQRLLDIAAQAGGGATAVAAER